MTENKEIDYEEIELTKDIKHKTILGLKFIFLLSFLSLLITLILSII